MTELQRKKLFVNRLKAVQEALGKLDYFMHEHKDLAYEDINGESPWRKVKKETIDLGDIRTTAGAVGLLLSNYEAEIFSMEKAYYGEVNDND